VSNSIGGLGTPVLFIVFNRPDAVRVAFERIREAKPRSLFVAGDGPRADVAGERERCEEARNIAMNADWDCDVHTRFQPENLGPGPGVSSAITWFFDNVEAGIILEDDCVPSRSFFPFCEELLRHYKDTTKVMHISGHNYQYGHRRGKASYYFSKYAHVGGWATWQRAWQSYDIRLIPEHERGEIWDAAWLFSVWKNDGVAAIPNANLVSNIGFGPDATHTRIQGRFSCLPAIELEFPLRHPVRIAVDPAADRLTHYANFRNIPDLRLLWMYEALDFLVLLLPRVRKLVAKIRNLGRSVNA
jgi:hypothetical protein